MPSHLSTIGFEIRDEADFVRLAETIAPLAKVVPANHGRYLRWGEDDGEQLWLQVDEAGELIGMNPHFAGKSRVPVGITTTVRRADDSLLDGAFHAWASPPSTDPEEGTYPFVFDVPDFAAYRDLAPPTLAEAQIAAFAHEIDCYDDATSFERSQSEDEVRFASQSFIPSGLFSSEESDDGAPAYAVINGHVLETAQRTNALTREAYWWILVDSLGGSFDVVVDPALLTTPPVVGGVVSGSFWLSGRLVAFER